MKEKFKELLNQSTNPSWDGELGAANEFNLEKFSELIVQECANVCRDDGRWFQEQDDKVEAGVAYALCYKIKEHFGVEE
jgi:hypothetical protein